MNVTVSAERQLIERPDSAPRSGRPARGEIDIRKQRVLDVATQLFLAHGFADTTLDAIGRGAGVAKRTIYHHIGDKEAVFRAIYERRDLPQSVLRFAIRPEMSVAERLTTIARALLAYYLDADNENVALQRLLASESSRFPDLAERVINTAWSTLNPAIEAVFDQMIAEGLIPPTDSMRSAVLFFDMAVGNSAYRLMLGYPERGPSPDQLAERIDTFLNGRFPQR
jgi:TetR/AcrR family transcriptional repressor of mexJK operon